MKPHPRLLERIAVILLLGALYSFPLHAENTNAQASDVMKDLQSLEVQPKMQTMPPAAAPPAANAVSSLAFKYSPAWIEKPSSTTGQAPTLITAPQPPPSEPDTASTSGKGRDYSGLRTGLRLLPYGLHYCFFADSNTPEDSVEQKIRLIVNRYADCGIAVEPHVYTMTTNYPHDPQALKAAALQACNVQEMYGQRGAVQLDISDPAIAQQMCNDPGALGCSTLCERLSFSVVAPGAGPGTGLHESGHSNCCGALCVNKGQGIKPAGDGGLGLDLVAFSDWNRPRDHFLAAEGAGIKGGNFNPAACDSLRAGASTRPEGFQDMRGKRRFYSRAAPGKQVDITLGRGVLEAEPKPHDQDLGQAQGEGNADIADGAGPEPDGPVDLTDVLTEDEVKQVIGSVGPSHPMSSAGRGPASLRGAGLSAGLGSGGDGAQPDEIGPQRLEYDESVSKLPRGASSPKGGAAAITAGSNYEGMPGGDLVQGDLSPSTTRTSTKAVEMDEGAPKGMPSRRGGAGPATPGQGGSLAKAYASIKRLILGSPRQRGASLKRDHPLKVQAEDLESARAPADFAVDPNKDPGE